MAVGRSLDLQLLKRLNPLNFHKISVWRHRIHHGYHSIVAPCPSRLLRHTMNSERGGGSTARRILSHGLSGFSHNSRICRGAYKHISRIAHPDKNLMRNAYYCAVAEIIMEAAKRTSDIVTSPSSSDRDAFSLVPALDSAQFSALVDSHRQATQGRTPLVRSAPAID